MRKEEIRALTGKYQNYYAGRIARDLYDTGISPELEIGDDASAWTCVQRDGNEVVHIGLGMFGEFPDGTPVCSDENDFHVVMRVLTGHEAGHQKYTTLRAFSGVIENGRRGFVEYAWKHYTGHSIRITKESDIKGALTELAKKYDVVVDIRGAEKDIHFIANSIEDGRMERRCSLEKPGFKNDVICFRGNTWNHSIWQEGLDLNNPVHFLICVQNQILSLATMGVWQKGFSKHIAGTRIETKVRELMPYITAGVTSSSCEKGMKNAQKVIELLYPEMLAALTIPEFSKELEKFFRAVSQSLPDFDEDEEHERTYETSEKDDAERGKEESSAPINIFTDDEKPDESQKSESSEEDKKGEQKKKPKEDGPNPKQNNSTAGIQEDDAASSSKQKDKNDSKPDAAEETENSAAEDSKSGSKGQESAPDGEDDFEKILKAMRDAAQNAQMASSSAIATAKAEEEYFERLPEGKDETLAGDIISSADLKKCGPFHEFMHEYQIDADLPANIQQESLLVRKSYEKYFMSRKKPVRKNQRSGKIDSHQLSRLVRGETDVFRLSAKDDSFSGCIEILLDNSGSMQGKKKKYACETLARIEESLKGLIPIKIFAFDSGGRVNIEIIKNWNEFHKKNCSWNYLLKSRQGGGTPTSTALKISREEMKKRTERHKLIVLLTDENASCSGNALSSVIASIKAEGIQLCAIYFENTVTQKDADAFRSLFGSRSSIVCRSENIGTYLLPVVRDFTRN